MNRLRLLAVTIAATATAGVALAQSGGTDNGVIGPQNQIQPSGRKLAPAGRLTPLGNHPGGGALTTNGRFLWALDAGRGRNDIRIVDADPALDCKVGTKGNACRTRAKKTAGKVIQTIPMPGVTGGIAMAPDGKTAYVSGVADSPHLDQKAPAGTPGLEGDVLHVFTYSATTGQATRAGLIPVPPPAGVPVPPGVPSELQITGPPLPQSFPPTETKPLSWPRDLAVSADGSTVLAA
ncbi:MAG: Lactonase, 7-bladed beta-propeller, partial [Thermoleophilaceae bacterium]|nr:Lactonase, 7-bladed beta-propeller [Thermoleophilaceae bacterium]